MSWNNFIGLFLALTVLYVMYKTMGPKPKPPSRRRKTQRRTVRVDPLLAKEARLAAELRQVRSEIRQRGTSLRHS